MNLLQYPNQILLVNLGRVHDDREQIADALKQKNFDVKYINLLEQDFSKIDFSNVAAVDLKGCRGWQKKIDFFREQLELLNSKVKETDRKIPISNPPEMFSWVDSKEYLAGLQKKSIPITPTVFIHNNDDIPDIFSLIDKSPSKKLVLKPAIGSLATDVIFISKKSGNEFDITCPKPSSDSPTPHIITVNREGLKNFVEGYKEKMFSQQNQPAFLIQEYCKGIEVSAVFVGDKAHFINRTTGASLVAHEDFGGKNTLEDKPPIALVELANKVRRSLPEHLKSPPYVRIDMLYDGITAPKLLEVEAGSARLFLNEAKRSEDYANMLEGLILKERNPKTKSIDNWQTSLKSKTDSYISR